MLDQVIYLLNLNVPRRNNSGEHSSYFLAQQFEWIDLSIVRFKLRHLQPAIKAIGTMATQTQIRLNAKGMLCIQHMLSLEDKKSCFIDFFLLPQEDHDE
jgi:hypothetical protein